MTVKKKSKTGSDAPGKMLEPFKFHGVELEWKDGSDQAVGDCPFCGKGSKFYVNVETGQWDCKRCMTGTAKGGGNVYTFLRLLWSESEENTDPNDLEALRINRKLLSSQTLRRWGVVKSSTTDEWLIPGYDHEKKLNQLYKYVHDKERDRMLLLPTPEIGGHQLFGVLNYSDDKEGLFVCEGPWDGMALDEIMRQCKYDDEGDLVVTGVEEGSMFSNCNVIAVPSCNVFKEAWSRLSIDKHTTFFYDSDHPTVNQKTGKTIQPAGYLGVQRAVQTCAMAEEPPQTVNYLSWGPDGYDPVHPSGYDLRDYLCARPELTARINLLHHLLERVEPVPNEWVAGRNPNAHRGGVDMECIPCDEWLTLIASWRKALKWTEGLDRALSCMLACVVSTKQVGDQLWIKVIGPAACGKSTLCEALSIAKKYVMAKSTIRGFHSGYRTDGGGNEDHSLAPKLKDKTLVTKDGDTLLQSPNLQQILSEARDLYDKVARTSYRTGIDRNYEGLNMTWILCGTSSLRSIDQSELGERFVDVVIMEGIDDDLEDEIILRAVDKADKVLSYESNGKVESQHDPDLVAAMQLTGGYINHLRESATAMITGVANPDEMKRRCALLGKFVAHMRARPSMKQEETAERELGTRLASQFVRLAKCLAVVLNRKEVDEEVMRRVTRTALDTARGRSLEIVRHLYREGKEGAELRAIGIWTNEAEEKLRKMMGFLSKIGVTEHFRDKLAGGLSSKPKYRLTEKMRNLYKKVVVDSSINS